MITKLEIEAFLTIERLGSVTAASEQLFVTQPALSKRIRSIEDELGCQLFERGRGARGVALTPEGEAFLPIARRWADIYGEALAVKDIRTRQTFRLAAVGNLKSSLLPALLAEMSADDSPYRLDFNLCHSDDGPELVRTGQADAALVDLARGSRHASDSVVVTPVYAEPFVLVGGPSWANVGVARLADLDPAREVRVPWDYGFDAWHDRRFDPTVQPHARLNSASILEFVLRDDLFCIAPKTEAMRLVAARPALAMAELDEVPPDQVIHLLSSPDRARAAKTSYFAELLARHVRALGTVRCLMRQP